MNIKQKIIKSRDEQPKSRYNLQIKNSESTPSLLKSKQIALHNKENSINQLNKNQQNQNLSLEKSYELEVINSMEFSKRLNSSNDEADKYNPMHKNQQKDAEDLRSSHEMFIFKQKNPVDRIQRTNFGGHSTAYLLGIQRRKDLGMITSRQFLQQKKVKNEVIDEMFVNVRRGLCKSINQSDLQSKLSCVNHLHKRAKYRLVSQLSEGEKEMFYCSKCAINLLQQGFQVQEIKNEEIDNETNQVRGQLISKLELRIKSLQERASTEMDRNDHNEQLDLIDQQINRANNKFNEFIDLIERLRANSITELQQLSQKKQIEQRIRRQHLFDISKNMQDIQAQIKEHKTLKKFISMSKNQFQFISTSLTNKVNGFEEILQSATVPTPKQLEVSRHIGYDFILAKLQQYITDQQETTLTRRERETTFEKRPESITGGHGEDEFICEQKKPFRILFPCEKESYSNISLMSKKPPQSKKSLLGSVRQCPSFNQFPEL